LRSQRISKCIRELCAMGTRDARAPSRIDAPMATQLVFLTLFLGLISGPQRVDLQPGAAVKSIRILLDGKEVAALQKAPWSAPLDVNQPHVLSASMQFEDGFVPRRELVIGGGVGDTADALLTPVAVRQSGETPPSNPSSCFTSAGSLVRVSAVEKGRAIVIAV